MGSNSGFSLGGIGKELECNNIDSYRYRRKGSLLIQTLYLRDRDRERGKNRRFHIVLLIEKSIWFFSYLSLNEKMGQIPQDQTKPVGLKEWWKKIKKEKIKKVNQNTVEESRFQTNKLKLDWKRIFLILEEWGQKDWSRKISCSYYNYKIVIGSA